MAISNGSSLKAQLSAAKLAFRHDIAEQLRAFGEVSYSHERLSVDLPEAGEGACVVVEFTTGTAPRPDLREWLRLRVTAGEDSVPLLTLGWDVADNDAQRLDLYKGLSGGLNAAARFREVGDIRREGLRTLLTRLGVDLSPGKVPSRAVVAASRSPVASAKPAVSPAPVPVMDAEFVAAESEDEVEANLGAAIEALPDEFLQEALKQFRTYLASHQGGGGLTRDDVEAFVADGMHNLYAFQDAHLEGRSTLTELMAKGRGLALIGALAVAYGGEVMVSGFAFGDMIRADAVNWPLAFTSSFLFGGGLIAQAPTEKQRQFWGRVGLAWALTIAGLSVTNKSLVGPLQDRLGVFLQETADLRDEAASKRALFQDLERKLADKIAAAAQDKAAYLGAKKNRPSVMAESGQAVTAAEAQRDAARDAALSAEQRSEAAKKADPSHQVAMAMVFVLSATITGAGQWFVGNYLNSRPGVHREALQAARARRRMRHSAQRLTKRKGQEGGARVIMASMRAEYMRQLEQSGRLSQAKIKAMVEAAFGKTRDETLEIVEGAVASFRGEAKRGRDASLFGWRRLLGAPRA
jgi:hypothetical protein